MEKECIKCYMLLSINNFHKDNNSKDGYRATCKNCRNKTYTGYNKDYYNLNKKRLKQNIYNYRKNNYDKHVKSNKTYYENNTDKIKEYYKLNKENILTKVKIYRKNNKERIRDKNNLYFNQQYTDNNLFKISKIIRNSISKSLKQNGYTKKSKTYEILGCSFEKFKEHLESQFEPWMNWKNYGLYNGELNYGWDIDHVIPNSSAKTEDEVITLNHYSNLQPLCSKVNRDIKRDNI